VRKSKVLLPSDGSETSLKAAAYAVRLMKSDPEISLTVLVVVPEGVDIGNKQLLEKINGILSKKGEEILAETIKVFNNEGLFVDGVIKMGDPACEIVDLTRRGNFNHIIMGSRGASKLRDTGIGIGSVSHKVVQLADCRVTLVK